MSTDNEPASRKASMPPGSSDWKQPLPLKLPRPTYWPAVLALGVVFLFWGFVTTLLISGIGLVVVVTALAGWIRELRHDA